MKTVTPSWLAAADTMELHVAGDSETGQHIPVVTTGESLPFSLARLLVWIADGDDQKALDIPLTARPAPGNAICRLNGQGKVPGRGGPEFSGEVILLPQEQGQPWLRADVTIRNDSRRALDTAAELNFVIPSEEIPRWLMPGVFYGDNGYDKTSRVYPRFHPTDFNAENFVSPYWSFRTDRLAAPVVLAKVGTYSYFVSTDEQFSHGMSALGFAHEAPSGRHHEEQETLSYLTAVFPWREVPVQYAPHNPNHLNGEVGYVELAPGEEMRFSLRIGIVEDPDNYGFAKVLRALYSEVRPRHEPRTWMSTSVAAELASYGIYHWFYQPGKDMLVETCGFDKYFAQARSLPCYVDRPHMHVSWVSGIPYAHALARWGEENGNNDYLDAGNAVIDRICREGISPCGAFWAQWTEEKNAWDAGWNINPRWLHARTLGEACTFLADAITYEESRGRKRPQWRKALKSNIDFALKSMRADGCMGTYYHSKSGKVEEWRGTAGMAWIPAFVKAAHLLTKDKTAAGKSRYLKAARLAGEFYSSSVEEAIFFGGCEDVSLSPCSEDGYVALMAYTTLYESTSEPQYLELAQRCAEWTMTFRWMYNTVFPENTFLEKYDYRTVGGDVASPPNQHLHNYGLIAYEALMKLWMWTSDCHYLDRARDNLHYSLQMIARTDGDMNARRGMMSEQWYHTEWWQPKGCMLQLAHVWCAGLLIIARQAHLRLVETAPKAVRKEIEALDPVTPRE